MRGAAAIVVLMDYTENLKREVERLNSGEHLARILFVFPPIKTFPGYGYGTGSIVETEGKEAVKWYRMAARKGHDEAQYSLGDACLWGEKRGVPLDCSQAEKWFLKAAKWYKKAIDREYWGIEAAFEHGAMYLTGMGVRQK